MRAFNCRSHVSPITWWAFIVSHRQSSRHCSSSGLPEIGSRGSAAFQWQTGYAVFSVSASNAPRVRRYVENQDEHHRVKTFQDELRAFFRRHQMEFDERYVWD
jgi:hypothetical protein